MDVSLGLDLGVDSLEWLGLTLEIERRAGVRLDEAEIAGVATIRDLLRVVADAPPAGVGSSGALWNEPERLLSPAQSRWLAPLGPGLTMLSRALMAANGVLMRLVFRLRTVGLERLPSEPWVLAPNHASFLDPLVLSAALGRDRLERSYWGGWTGVAFANSRARGVSRVWRVLPIDPERGAGSSLALAAAVLKRGDCLIWFPEGERSRTGKLLPFRPGIGTPARSFPAPGRAGLHPGNVRGVAAGSLVNQATSRDGDVRGPPRTPAPGLVPGAPPEEAAGPIVRALETAVTDLERGAEGSREKPTS